MNKTATADNSISFLSDNNNNNNTDGLDNDDHDDDVSDDSSSGSSDGGMSIGARAALQDHVRYVARYGVDGDAHRNSFRHFDIDDDDEDDNVNDDDNSNDCEDENVKSTRIKLANHDAVWNQLLDTSFASPTLSTVTSTDGNILDRSQVMNRSNLFERNVQNKSIIIVDDNDNNSEQENGGVEVSLVDTSACYSDYFNTSKVWLLATPEKIKKRPQPNFPSTFRRPQHHHHQPADLDSDSFHADSDSAHLTDVMLALHLHHHENPNDIPVHANTMRHGRASDNHEASPDDANESFAGGVDVSRISAADSERTPLRGSPRRWIVDGITTDSATTTPQRLPDQRLADVSFGSLLSPVMPVTPLITISNIRRTPSRNSAPPSLPNDNQDVSHVTPFRPRPQRTSATIPEHYDTDYPHHQPAFWLSPTEAQAADLANEFGAWTAEPAPFPDDVDGASAVCGLKSNATRLSPWEEGKERPRFAFGETQKPSIHRQPHKPLGFPDDYSSVASSSGATSLFLLDDTCPKATNRSSPIHSPPIDGDPKPDVSFNVSAIEDDSTDGLESWSRRPEPSPMTSASDRTPPILPPESSLSSSLSSSLPILRTTHPVATTTKFDQMEDRRRYRTVVPNRVLFDETDDNHYHHCRDDSFSVAPSY